MREKFIDYLIEQPGYKVQGNYLRRQDNTIAGRLIEDNWLMEPIPEEVIGYVLGTGRCMPCKLVEKDLTNPGAP
ncbi:hypothetical protein J4227_04600 [Candidatus Woesearchaeota archaeon]|nr:hypothetical protein [Candidatus Woesearchaeota archaeon]